MKAKFTLIMLSAMFILSVTSCDDDNKYGKRDLPEAAQGFIDFHLAGYKILDIAIVDNVEDEMNEKYIVLFSNDILVSFSSLGYWRRIESNTELPELLQSVLPYDAAAVYKEKFPVVTINKIIWTLYGCKVIPSIGLSAAFYDIGTSNKFGVDITDEKSYQPQLVSSFISAYYEYFTDRQDYYIIQESEEDGSGFRFELSDGQKAYFDKDGHWYYCSSKYPSDEMYEVLLPPRMFEIIKQDYGYSSNRVCEVLRDDTYYQAKIEMGNGMYNWVLFDIAADKEVETPHAAVLDFLTTYVGVPIYEITYHMVLEFYYGQLVRKIEGNWKKDTRLIMYTDAVGKMLCFHLHGESIPNKILTYLPEKVKEYLETCNAADSIKIVCNGLHGEYFIVCSDVRINFDKEWNYVSKYLI